MLKIFRQILKGVYQLFDWRKQRFLQALVEIESIYLDVLTTGKASWAQCRKATNNFVQINLFHVDFFFLVGGIALLIFVTRSFSEVGIDYGPWRPVVISLAALFAATIPMILSLVLFPIHIMMRASTWGLAFLNIVLSAHIFAIMEPVIPAYFYSEGVFYYDGLIFGAFVFYTLAIGYLHLRLNTYFCFNCYKNRQINQSIHTLVPPDMRGDIISLSAKDHYVEIVTENGSYLYRMSMKEAIALVPAETGLHVHRSHWVSYSAMLLLKETGERHVLILRNGHQVPVSKSQVCLLKSILEHR